MSEDGQSDVELAYPDPWDDDDLAYDAPEVVVASVLGHVQVLEELIGDNGANIISLRQHEDWSRRIDDIRFRAQLPRTVIGFYGDSGAGKSSLINAILNRNVLPTSQMGRACTATAIEIEWHAKETIEVEIQYTFLEEWTDKVTFALGDLSDAERHVDDVLMHEMKAVYPSFKEDASSVLRIGDLRKAATCLIDLHPETKDLLGSTISITCEDDEEVLSRLAPLTSSGSNKEPASWPLLSHVRIQCCAEVLRTGAVLVDLPGLKDKNAARRNIAIAYMKRCDCMCIVAPIGRANDNQTADNLLDEAVRIQLQMDSLHTADKVAFVATRSDDPETPQNVMPYMTPKTQRELKDLEATIDRCRSKIRSNAIGKAQFKVDEQEALKQRRRICCKARNEHAKGELAIQLHASMRLKSEEGEMDADTVAGAAYRVFTVSSREFLRLEDLAYENAECFEDAQDTGIPDVIAWCIASTTRSRVFAAATLVDSVMAFVSVASACLADADMSTPVERNMLHNLWRSEIHPAMKRDTRYIFDEVVHAQLAIFKGGLTPTIEQASITAASNAGKISDNYAGDSRCSSAYRAALRRHGDYNGNLNVKLVNEMTGAIAAEWTRTFQSTALDVLEKALVDRIREQLGRLVKSASPAMRESISKHVEGCVRDTRLMIQDSVARVQSTMSEGQRTISRSVAPFIQQQLVDTYEEAVKQKQKGSFLRQKALFRKHLDDTGEELFARCKTRIESAVTNLGDVVKKALLSEILGLPAKVDHNLSPVWHGQDMPQQSAAREALKHQLDLTQQWACSVYGKSGGETVTAYA